MIIIITDAKKLTPTMTAAVQAIRPDFQPYADKGTVNLAGVQVFASRREGKSIITTTHLRVENGAVIPGFRISLAQLGLQHEDQTFMGALLPYWADATFNSEAELRSLVDLAADLEAKGFIGDKGRIMYSQENNEGFRLANLSFSTPGSFAVVEVADEETVISQKAFFNVVSFNVHLAEWTTSIATTSNSAVAEVIAATGVMRVSNKIGVTPAVVANVGSTPITTTPATENGIKPRTLAAFG
jgi:hypothetical protein